MPSLLDPAKRIQSVVANTPTGLGSTLGDIYKNSYQADWNVTGRGEGWADAPWNRTGDDDANTSPYVYYYGGGGGYSGPSAEDIQKQTQAQINNTAGNYNKRGKDMSENAEAGFDNIKQQISQNNAMLGQVRRNNMMQTEWQPQQQKEQSTLMALRNRMGNAAWGSSLVDLAEGMGRVDDMADIQLINTYKQNENNAYNDWFQANESLIADYADQVNMTKDEFSKLYSQYWQAMSNLNPELATEENINKSLNGEESSFGEGTDAYTLPGATGILPSDALKELFKIPDRASAKNDKTYNYIRPNKGETSYTVNPWGGNANRHTAANSAFNDNLNAFRVRVKENPWDTE